MYKEHFRLTDMPFSIAPDPRFLYMSGRHREALAHLLYGVQGEGGIVLLTGEVGTGKTTLCRCLLEQIHSRCDVAFILNPKMSVGELLAAICDEFHVAVAPRTTSVKLLVDAINTHLLRANAEGRPAVLIVDEAQNLRPDVLEQLRLLTNLETNTRKLLQIILIGQPELQDMLARPELRQVAQRIVARYHLTPLTRAEAAAYVAHRLRVAGAQLPLFPDALMGSLHRMTGGGPRLINLVCDRALLGTYVQGKLQVTRGTLRQASREVFGAPRKMRSMRRLGLQLLILAALAGGGALASGQLAVPQWPIALLGRYGPEPAVPSPSPAEALPASTVPTPAPAPPEAPEAAALAPAPEPVPAPQPQAPAPPPQDLAWPDADVPRARSEALGFQALFEAYGIAHEPGAGASPCKAAEAAGMRCLQGRGGLADLVRFNQPALLSLDDGGREGRYHAVLRLLDHDAGTLVVAGQARHVPLAEIARMWSGDYTLLWRAPPGFRRTLVPGSRGRAVAWLRDALARLEGRASSGAREYDDELARQVRAFQRAEGMSPDGEAGPLTLVRLRLRVDEQLPRLLADAPRH